MTTIAIQRLVDGVLTSATTTSVIIRRANGTEARPQEVVAPSAAGIYSYDVTSLPAGDYVAHWIFTAPDLIPDAVFRSFRVEDVQVYTRGITLAELERRIAARVGPYFKHTITWTDSAPNRMSILRLRSSLSIGQYDDLFILRRGRLADGSFVTYYGANGSVLVMPSDDRVRIVASVDNENGYLLPDRVWTSTPLLTEAIELHALDPEQELRPIAQQALERCYFHDTITLAVQPTTREFDATALAPWISRPEQVLSVEYLPPGGQYLPRRIPWWQAYQAGSSVRVKTGSLASGSVVLRSLRPHSSYVNGRTNMLGPNDDDDILHVDPLYAVASGHLAAWMLHPERCAPSATGGLRLPLKEVAAEFTKRSRAIVPPEPEFVMLRFGQETEFPLQVGNA